MISSVWIFVETVSTVFGAGYGDVTCYYWAVLGTLGGFVDFGLLTGFSKTFCLSISDFWSFEPVSVYSGYVLVNSVLCDDGLLIMSSSTASSVFYVVDFLVLVSKIFEISGSTFVVLLLIVRIYSSIAFWCDLIKL